MALLFLYPVTLMERRRRLCHNQSHFLPKNSQIPSKCRCKTFIPRTSEGAVQQCAPMGSNECPHLWTNIPFYSFLKIKMKEDIAQEFPNLSSDVLETHLDRLCLIRNVCAHNERLYSFHFDKDFPDTDIHKQLRIPQKGEQYIYGKNDVFSSLIALRYLLPTEIFCKFVSELSGCIDNSMLFECAILILLLLG